MFHWSNFGGIFYKRWELTVTEGTNKNGQSRNTGNIGHTRYRTIQKYWQHWAHKIQDEDEQKIKKPTTHQRKLKR